MRKKFIDKKGDKKIRGGVNKCVRKDKCLREKIYKILFEKSF